MNINKIKHILGFSLIELMISLIVISCIVAAFAPVITKKLTSSSVAVSVGAGGGGAKLQTEDCDKMDGLDLDEDCALCDTNQCYVCNKTCDDGLYKNIGRCECVSCSDNFSQELNKCIRCDSKKCTKCDVGYYLNVEGGTEQCVMCEEGA